MYPFYTKFLSKKISDDIKDSIIKKENIKYNCKSMFT